MIHLEVLVGSIQYLDILVNPAVFIMAHVTCLLRPGPREDLQEKGRFRYKPAMGIVLQVTPPYTMADYVEYFSS